MKIWFDLTNSPHINFFRQMIEELKAEGHEVVITCRPLANTIDLLDLYKMDYTVVGKHYGKSSYKKALGFFVRVWQLRQFLKKSKVDVGISQSSFYSPIAGFLAGVPTIYTNDNEHAAGNKISFLFAKKIFIPEFIPKENVTNLFVKENKVIQYSGVKEGIYLWKKYKGFKLDTSKLNKIYIRTEPQLAQYYTGKLNFMDPIIKGLKDKYEVVLLPRTADQADYYSTDEFKGVTVCRKPLPFEEIAKDCLLFIGAGGTMTREMAVIGIPTISVYQDALLDVDKYLIKEGIMMHDTDLTAEKVEKTILKVKSKEANPVLLEKGENTFNMIKNQIINL